MTLESRTGNRPDEVRILSKMISRGGQTRCIILASTAKSSTMTFATLVGVAPRPPDKPMKQYLSTMWIATKGEEMNANNEEE